MNNIMLRTLEGIKYSLNANLLFTHENSPDYLTSGKLLCTMSMYSQCTECRPQLM